MCEESQWRQVATELTNPNGTRELWLCAEHFTVFQFLRAYL